MEEEMIFCKYCGAEILKEAAFCNKCGKATKEIAQEAKAAPPVEQKTKIAQPVEPSKKNKPGIPPLIIALAVIAVIGIPLAVFFFIGDGGKAAVDFSIVPVKGPNGEYQYIDVAKKGKIVINPQFSEAHIFRDGLALVKTSGKDGKYGYIDKKGKYAIAPSYDYAQDFGEGVAWVQLEDQPPMLIDKKGKMLLQVDSLTLAKPFYNGYAMVSYYSQKDLFGMFIDKEGKPLVTQTRDKFGTVINDGLYAFQSKDSKKWGYKNTNGEVVINEQFDAADAFFEGVAVVEVGEKYGIIDKKGNFVVNPQYDVLDYDSDGLFIVRIGDILSGKYGWVNKKGEVTINPQFDEINPFYGNKLAPVKMGPYSWGYIDRNGQVAINPQFKNAYSFFGDYAPVIKDGLGFINKKGEFVVPPQYDWHNFIEYVYAIGQKKFSFHMPAYSSPHMGFFLWFDDIDDLFNLSNTSCYSWEEQYVSGHCEKFLPYEKLREKLKAQVIIDVFTDSKDGKQYKTVKIGEQTWMAENLNTETGKSVCYENKDDNCKKYGRLYDWETAMKACPSGWHLPSKAEWQELVDFEGLNPYQKKKYETASYYDDLSASMKIDEKKAEKKAEKPRKKTGGGGKSRKGQSDDSYSRGVSRLLAEKSYKFNFKKDLALPGGFGRSDGNFSDVGSFGHWWSASEGDAGDANSLVMEYLSSDGANWKNFNTSSLLSVLCLKDSEKREEYTTEAETTDPSVVSVAENLASLMGDGGSSKGKIKLPSAKDINMGRDANRSRAEIMAVVNQHVNDLKSIYTRYLENKPGFTGNITLKFTIASSGDITDINIVSTTTTYPAFNNAIKEQVSKWKWKQIKSGYTTTTIPFNFVGE